MVQVDARQPDRAESADPSLTLQQEHSLVETPGEKEGAVEAAEILGGNWGLEGLVDTTSFVNDRQILD